MGNKKKAFTFVELLFVIGLLSLLSMILFQISRLGRVAVQKEHGRSQSLASAARAYELLAHDVRQAACYGHNGSEMATRVALTINGKELSVPTEKGIVRFGCVHVGSDRFLLTRNDKTYRSIELNELKYELIVHKRKDGKSLSFLKIQIVGYSPIGKDMSTIKALFCLDSHTTRALSPHWVEVPGQLMNTI